MAICHVAIIRHYHGHNLALCPLKLCPLELCPPELCPPEFCPPDLCLSNYATNYAMIPNYVSNYAINSALIDLWIPFTFLGS